MPIFQAVLPNGKVLMGFSGTERAGVDDEQHLHPRAGLESYANPATTVRKDVPDYNIFCAGYTQLANGNVLVVGGNKNAALDGIVQTHIFDWRKEEQGQPALESWTGYGGCALVSRGPGFGQ